MNSPSPLAPSPTRQLPWLLLLVLLVAQSEALAHRVDHLADPGEGLDCEICLSGAALDSPLTQTTFAASMADPPAVSTPVPPPCWPLPRRDAHHPRDPPAPSGPALTDMFRSLD
mgnify:CR=1 FL=1